MILNVVKVDLVVRGNNMKTYKRPTYEEILEASTLIKSTLETDKKLTDVQKVAYRNQLLALDWVLGFEKKFVHYNKEDLYD